MDTLNIPLADSTNPAVVTQDIHGYLAYAIFAYRMILKRVPPRN